MHGSYTDSRRLTVLSQELSMKLPLITAALVAYVIVAAVWICYNELMPN